MFQHETDTSNNVEIKCLDSVEVDEIRAVEMDSTNRPDFDKLEDILQNEWKPVFKDGDIPISELIKNFKLYYNDAVEKNPSGISEKEMTKIIKKTDLNKDKKIDFDEFRSLILKKTPSVISSQKKLFIRLLNRTTKILTLKREEKKVEYEPNRTCCPPPLFTILVTLIDIVILLYYFITMKNAPLDYLVPINSTLIYNPHRTHEPWRFFSYAFLHGGLLHLISNILLLLFLGITLETVHKSHRVAPIFISGVIAGSLSVSVLDTKTFLLGSSGGVFALLGAHIANVILNYKVMNKGIGINAPVRIFILLLIIVFNIGASKAKILKHKQPQQSLFTHLFGSISGLLVGLGLLKDIGGNKWKALFGVIGLSLYILMITLFIEINLFKSYLDDD